MLFSLLRWLKLGVSAVAIGNVNVWKTSERNMTSLPQHLLLGLKRFNAFGKKNCKPISVNDFVSINASLFALRGVILHHGSDSLSGHYTSCIKTSDNQWIHCNDAHVRQCQMLK